MADSNLSQLTPKWKCSRCGQLHVESNHRILSRIGPYEAVGPPCPQCGNKRYVLKEVPLIPGEATWSEARIGYRKP